MNKQLAKVTKASLEFKDRHILNFWIHVEYEDGGGQGIGGYALDTYDAKRGHRVGTAAGCEIIRRILEEFDVNDLTELKGRNIWVLGEGKDWDFKPKGIQPLKTDNSSGNAVVFEKIFKEFLVETTEF